MVINTSCFQGANAAKARELVSFAYDNLKAMDNTEGDLCPKDGFVQYGVLPEPGNNQGEDHTVRLEPNAKCFTAQTLFADGSQEVNQFTVGEQGVEGFTARWKDGEFTAQSLEPGPNGTIVFQDASPGNAQSMFTITANTLYVSMNPGAWPEAC